MDIVPAGEFKRGDTLAFILTINNKITHEPITGLVPNLKCQGRYGNGTLGLEMQITEYNDGSGTLGRYLFYNNKTNDIMPGTLYFDVQWTINPENPDPMVISTGTFTLTVVKDETR
jgi:hypothetical protein